MLCIWNNVFNNSSYNHVVMWLRSLKGADPGAEKQMKVKMKKKYQNLKSTQKFEVRLNLAFNIWEMRFLQLLFDMWLVRQYLFFKSAQKSSFVFVTQHDTSSISWEWIAWQVVAFYVTSPNKETSVMRNYPVFLFVCLLRACVFIAIIIVRVELILNLIGFIFCYVFCD